MCQIGNTAWPTEPANSVGSSRTTFAEEMSLELKDPESGLLPLPPKGKAKLSGLDGLDRMPRSTEIKGPSGRIFTGTSLCGFRPADVPRRWAILFVESRPFDPVILLTIMCNCITMAWESPLDPCCTSKAAFIDVRALTPPPAQL